MSEPVNFVVEHYDNEKIAEVNEQLALIVTRLQADNAKLRELVRDMYPSAKAFLQLGVRLGCNDTLSYEWELQMRELGIEVE